VTAGGVGAHASASQRPAFLTGFGTGRTPTLTASTRPLLWVSGFDSRITTRVISVARSRREAEDRGAAGPRRWRRGQRQRAQAAPQGADTAPEARRPQAATPASAEFVADETRPAPAALTDAVAPPRLKRPSAARRGRLVPSPPDGVSCFLLPSPLGARGSVLRGL